MNTAAPSLVQEIHHTCVHLQDISGKPSLIVIDDLQAVTANEAGVEPNAVAGTLKSLAAELDVPIILLSQLDHSKNQP